ncbi:AMP-binding protein [Streptomyces sp. NBRC 109706]|uniref:AMP-binding protein n=1 Tax=Streptomyces sp. NBRC 109706 TaxID=1550035 RepID=UPI0007855BDD|nr:AMP-binding protein [Streptomyces sp. NBRC 109706]
MQLWKSLTNGSSHGVLHVWAGEDFEHTPWRAVVADAHGLAASLRAAGVRPGTRVATILTNTPATVRGLLAIWLAGGAVASLPLPTRGQSDAEYGQQVAVLCERLDPTLLLADEAISALLPDRLTSDLPVLPWTLSGLAAPAGPFEPSPPGPNDLAFVQYSSGSTSTPKGCALTTRAIEAQMEIILSLTGGRPGNDTVTSWLPLSHDMGMFGCLLYAWAYDFHFVLSTPERFGMAPRTWFRDMSEYESTMTAGTSTAVYLATRAQGRAELPRGLASLRAAVIGAERLDWETMRAATERFGAYGMARTALQPAYGMAEATLAVSGKPWDQELRGTVLDGSALVDGVVAEVAEDHPRATRLVSNGPALPGVTLDTGAPGTVGEIVVRSPSLAEGYLGDPERTAARFPEGRLRTGDLGFTHEGEIYVVGRLDDMLSVGGRKVYASEMESAIDNHPQIRKGCVALVDVGTSGLPSLVLMIEPQGRPKDYQPIADHAAAAALEKSGVALTECLFLPRGALPRTPSGKIQRFRCRSLLTEGRLEPLARVVYA